MILKVSKTTKIFFTVVCLFALVLMGFRTVVRAADTGAVTATVTARNISITITTDGTVAYGTLENNSTKSTQDLSDTQTANNNGNVTENFNIMGSNSASWTLAGTAGSDTYVHQFCTASCTTPPTNYTALTTSYTTMASSIAKDANQTFDLYINTPTSSTVYTEQSVDVTVQAVAS